MDLKLTGRRALICGGSSGLGRAVAAALVGEGAHVVLLSRNAEALKAVADELSAEGPGRAGFVTADNLTPQKARILLALALAGYLATRARAVALIHRRGSVEQQPRRARVAVARLADSADPESQQSAAAPEREGAPKSATGGGANGEKCGSRWATPSTTSPAPSCRWRTPLWSGSGPRSCAPRSSNGSSPASCSSPESSRSSGTWWWRG